MDRSILSQCEQEPLQFSGAIQAHGALMVVDAHGVVTHVSSNLQQLFQHSVSAWLGKPVTKPLALLIEQLLARRHRRLSLIDAIDAPHPLDVVLNRAEGNHVVLEFFPHFDYRPIDVPTVNIDASSMEVLCQCLTEAVAAATGFPRVMLYWFRENGDGEVVNEVRQGEAYGSYLGLRYPASDVPQIARALYIKNPWRWIPDACAEPLAIAAWQGAAPDLSYSDLRSVSPVHRVYLGNMGVRASLSLPIVMAEQLVGLVACHHNQPQDLPLGLLERVAEIVQVHVMQMAAYRSRQRMLLVDGLNRRFNHLQEKLRLTNVVASWDEIAAWLLGEFRCDGAALCLDGQSYLAGEALEPATLAFFDQWFVRRDEPIWMGDSLVRSVAQFPISQSAGILALQVKLANDRQLRLYLNRVEHIHEVAWGGNPDKPVEIQDGTLNIAPRRSFEKWLEKRIGYCRPWDNESRLLLLKLRELLTARYG